MGPEKLLKMVEVPRRKLNRLQSTGLAFIIVGIATTVGILIFSSFHPINLNRRAGLLNESELFILVGVGMFLFGWNRRRRKPARSARE